MSALAQKALTACAEHTRLKWEITKLTGQIGLALGACPKVDDETHVARAYKPVCSAEEWPEERYRTPAEIALDLSYCEHCQAAHAAIQQRKAARKQLGIVRRQITAIGKAAAKLACA